MSYSDAKKHKKTHTAHSTDASEDTPSIGDSTDSLNEDTCFKMYDDTLDQLMENDDEKKLKVWASDVERRDVYLPAKKTLFYRSRPDQTSTRRG